MSVSNRARRVAKRRKQRGSRDDRGSSPQPSRADQHQSARPVDVRSLLLDTVSLIQAAPKLAGHRARQLLDGNYADDVQVELGRLLGELTPTVLERNWTPSDLAEITRRRLSAKHVPVVAAFVSAAHNCEPQSLDNMVAFQAALEIAAMFRSLPPIPDVTRPPGGGPRSRGANPSSAVLAKVRALLAKAESTEFPAEAEALSAKAQELIATYALDRYAAQLDAPAYDPSMTVRRLWIDAPYVEAKALLVDAVAVANHCQSVLSTSFGFVTLVGHGADVDATELLVTSLQVQADRAMLRLARTDHGQGGSTSRSFRRSFLVSYASRIRERLRHAADEVLATSARSNELVPVMARNDERVREVTAELFPEITSRRTAVSNYAGWVAGRAAADLARLGIRDGLTDQAAS